MSTMSDLEEEFLLAVERADVDTVGRLLATKQQTGLNLNCRDPLDRDALVIAIDIKNLEMIKLLLGSDMRICDALLYAIQDNFVEAVELLLGHSCAGSKRPGQSQAKDPYSADQSCLFSCDMTPLMLAAQKNNLEIIKLLLLHKVSPIPNPHDPRCGCDPCCRARSSDCLKHSRARINAYKALSSPSLMALSSADPLASAFEMSAKLEHLAEMEPEYKADYMRLRAQCQAFAAKLLDYTRTSKELEILLNFDGRCESELTQLNGNYHNGAGHSNANELSYLSSWGDSTLRAVPPPPPPPSVGPPRPSSTMKRSRLARLKLAIQCKQKSFCAHPNIQELLASMWYENLPGFRRMNVLEQTLQVVCIGLMFPIYSIAYLVAPRSQFGSHIKKPFIKFICHSASYITFIIVLILASQRVEAFYKWNTVVGLFLSGRGGSLLDTQQQQQQQQQHLHGVNSISSPAVLNNFSLWRASISGAQPAGSFSDDADINTLTALYKHQAAASSARGLESLSRIFEELPASSKRRGTAPSPIESLILIWVLSLIWAELKQIKSLGMNYYRHDMWNILDSVASGCYIGTIILRLVSYVQADERSLEMAREHWSAYDPTLLSEGLFATATIFSALKLVYIFSVNPYLGPLQISLGRMIVDILRFSWIYMLVLFAFACGMNQLLWYYADLERHQCLNVTNYNLAQYYKARQELFEAPERAQKAADTGAAGAGAAAAAGATAAASAEDDGSSLPPVTIDDSCKTWRHFSNVFESSQTLFWANFGLVDLENFDLTGIRQYTRFWALLMFGCYCFINVIVVLNLLIAMMNHSYVKISKRSDIEWKFARTRLWVSYFDDGSTVPAPFNIIPSIKATRYFLRRVLGRQAGGAKAVASSDEPELELGEPAKYYAVMRSLVGRYLVAEQRQSNRRLTESKLRRWFGSLRSPIDKEA